MDLGTILGLLSGVGIIFLGILRQDGDLGWFMNINSIIIVFGGTIAAAMVNYPLKNIIGLFSVLKNAFTSEEHDYQGIIGEIVEQGPCGSVFDKPSHPYTQALFSSTPIPDPNHQRQRVNLIGTVPNIAKPPTGCRFHTRCPEAMEICHKVKPQTHTIADQHTSACHLLADSH